MLTHLPTSFLCVLSCLCDLLVNKKEKGWAFLRLTRPDHQKKKKKKTNYSFSFIFFLIIIPHFIFTISFFFFPFVYLFTGCRREGDMGISSCDDESSARLRIRYRRLRWPRQSALCQRRSFHRHLGRHQRRPGRGKATVSTCSRLLFHCAIS